MAKALTIAALTLALTLAFMNTAQAAKTNTKSKSETISGVAVQVTKTILVVEVQGDGKKTKRVPIQLTGDTTYTGGELVRGANVTVTVKAGKATSVDVPAATK